MSARVTFPVQLNVDAAALMGDGLESTAAQLAGMLQAYFLLAQRELQADGIDADAKVTISFPGWTGPARRTFENGERRQIEKRLHAAVEKATRLRLPPPAPTEDYRIHSYPFKVRYGAWLDFLKAAKIAEEPDLRELYADVLDERVEATAWVIDVQRTILWADFSAQIKANATEVLGPAFTWRWFSNPEATATLRKLDPKRLAALPDAHPGTAPPVGSRAMSLGMRLVYVAAKPPVLALTDLIEAGIGYSATLAWNLASSLIDLNEVARILPVTRDEVDRYSVQYGGDDVTIRVVPFRVRRRSSDGPLRAFLMKLAEEQLANASFFAAVVRLRAAAEVPGAGGALPADVSAALDSLTPRADWKPGDFGALVYAVLDRNRIRGGAAAEQAHWGLSARADGIIVALGKSDGWGGPERRTALIDVFRDWNEANNPLAIEAILDELERRGQLGRLFEVLGSDHYDDLAETRIRVLGAVAKTRYKDDPRVQGVARKQTALTRGAVFQITVDVDANDQPTNLRFTHTDEKVFPAGSSDDPKAGVIAETSSYFSTVSPVSRPKPATLARLKEPTKRKIGDLMAAMMCGKGETRTREQLIAQAMQEASEELEPKLTEKDFDRVKMRQSLRLRRIERRAKSGIHVFVMHVEKVRRFGDEAWETIGPLEEMSLGELDAEMMRIHVGHELAFLTTFIIAETLIVGILFVAATGGAIALLELTFAITVRELIYYFTTDAADKDIDGYLTAALYGVVDVIGFRLGSALAGKFAQAVVTEAALTRVATKWILYIGKGIVASSALGLTQVLEKFGDDLFHLTSCRRWSSPWDYLKEFGYGFAMGLAFEFAIAPALSIAMRGAIRGLSKMTASAKDVAEVLMKEMTAEELEQTVKEALPKVESAVANTMKAEKAGFVREFIDALKKHLDEVIAHAKAVSEPKGAFAKMKAEWTSRAVKELLEHAKIPVSPNASTALDRLIRTVSTDEMNAILDTVIRGRGVRGLLERYPDGAVALLQMYRSGPAELERLLGSLEHVGADEAQSVIAALLRMQRLSEADRAIISWLAGTAPKELAAFLRAAEEQELRSFLGFLTKNPGTKGGLAATLLEEGARQPGRLAAVTKLLGERLAAGEATEAAAVRDLFTLSEEALAEETRLVKQRALRKGATPDEAAKSLEKGQRFGDRKKANEDLHADAKRVADDLERARIEQERYRDMKTGDPARGGERRPLAFETWQEYDEFKKEFEAMVRGLREGKPVTAQGQVIGSSTSFYSGNPDKPLGHFYDRKAPKSTGDLDVDVFCPELVRDMLDAGSPAINEKILVDGERTIFKNNGTKANPGFHDRFPQVRQFANRWRFRLGRDVDVKLRLDLDLPPVPKAGPIEVFRTAAPPPAPPAPKAPEPPNRD